MMSFEVAASLLGVDEVRVRSAPAGLFNFDVRIGDQWFSKVFAKIDLESTRNTQEFLARELSCFVDECKVREMYNRQQLDPYTARGPGLDALAERLGGVKRGGKTDEELREQILGAKQYPETEPRPTNRFEALAAELKERDKP